jgi:hypothetical protein
MRYPLSRHGLEEFELFRSAHEWPIMKRPMKLNHRLIAVNPPGSYVRNDGRSAAEECFTALPCGVDGDVRMDGRIVGKVESDGDVRKEGQIICRAPNVKKEYAAAIFFFGFFD